MSAQDDLGLIGIASPLIAFGVGGSLTDEFLDRLYMNGSKEDGKYILTLTQATNAAKEIYNEFLAPKVSKKTCYCGKPIDYSNPDCVEFSLCEDHAMDV